MATCLTYPSFEIADYGQQYETISQSEIDDTIIKAHGSAVPSITHTVRCLSAPYHGERPGGDRVLTVETDEGLLVVVTDVTGHGWDAAKACPSILAILYEIRDSLLESHSCTPERFALDLNTRMSDVLDTVRRDVEVAILGFDDITHHVKVCSMGGMTLFHKTANGDIENVAEKGSHAHHIVWPGYLPIKEDFSPEDIESDGKDSFLICTDGLLERKDDVKKRYQIGEDSVKEYINEVHPDDEDDVTAVFIR